MMTFYRAKKSELLSQVNRIKPSQLWLIALLPLCFSVNASTSTNTVENNPAQAERHGYAFDIKQPAKLAKKLYRKALFHYFQGQSELALQQLAYNKARLNRVDDSALLFEAGLQVSLGLYTQAEKNLTLITEKLANSPEEHASNEHGSDSAEQTLGFAKSKDLLAVALLQLAEQQINQQYTEKAQQTLAKLQHLPSGYYQQYHVLSQLAYWPQPAKLHLAVPEVTGSDEGSESTESSHAQVQQNNGYILLNQALLQIERGQVEAAEQALTALKRISWQAPEQSFWQQLFSRDESAQALTSPIEQAQQALETKHQQQSLQDYASLLLAQLYVEQQEFSLAYRELANFPQNSPFTEKALFLFAYASLKTQHYQESSAIFSLLSARYPLSYLAWQADALLARQYLLECDLDGALNQYLANETNYQQQLTHLQNVEQKIKANNLQLSTFLLALGESEIESESENKNASSDVNNVRAEQVWWHKALAQASVSGQLAKVDELSHLSEKLASQQQQVQWLDYALELNDARQAKIIAQQQAQNYQATIAQLKTKRAGLADSIKAAEQSSNANAFADQQQRGWLQRINNSHSVLTAMQKDDKYRSKAAKYQQRIKRVEGVLAWQLQDKFPQRLWQHQSQLKQLDMLLKKLQQQMAKVETIQQLAQNNRAASAVSSSENKPETRSVNRGEQLNLTLLKHRQSNIAQHNGELQQRVVALEQLANENLQSQVLAFIAQQRQSLNYYLHHTRRAMAKVLEELKNLDVSDNVDVSENVERSEGQG
ncbi:MAG: tetratricopeptide repeat protein [Cognaticolwellia sp.]